MRLEHQLKFCPASPRTVFYRMDTAPEQRLLDTAAQWARILSSRRSAFLPQDYAEAVNVPTAVQMPYGALRAIDPKSSRAWELYGCNNLGRRHILPSDPVEVGLPVHKVCENCFQKTQGSGSTYRFGIRILTYLHKSKTTNCCRGRAGACLGLLRSVSSRFVCSIPASSGNYTCTYLWVEMVERSGGIVICHNCSRRLEWRLNKRHFPVRLKSTVYCVKACRFDDGFDGKARHGAVREVSSPEFRQQRNQDHQRVPHIHITAYAVSCALSRRRRHTASGPRRHPHSYRTFE